MSAFLKQIKEKWNTGKNWANSLKHQWPFQKTEYSSPEQFLSTDLRQKKPVRSVQQTTRVLPSKPFQAYQKTQSPLPFSQTTTVRFQTVAPPPKSSSGGVKWLPFLFLVLGIFSAILFSKFSSEAKEEDSQTQEEVLWQVHEVKTGDTLWSLACFYYGSPQFWKEIFLANTDELKRSGTLEPGSTLIIPYLSAPLKQ